MHWPWGKEHKETHSDNRDITDPARDEIQKAQVRMDRINRILKEARSAEKVVMDVKLGVKRR